MLTKFYVTLSSLLIGYYAMGAARGWEYGNPQPEMVPHDVRQASPRNWSRSHVFVAWHTGYRGGK